VSGPSTGGIWDPLRASPDSSGYIKQLLSQMPKANAFNAGDGLNTASFSWERGRSGGLSGANAAALADPNGVGRKQFTIRLDENLTQRHRISGEWSIERTNSATNAPNWPDGLFADVIGHPQTITASVTSTLSANLVNEFRFGLRQDWSKTIPPWQSADSGVQ